jgi:hypothetical protein
VPHSRDFKHSLTYEQDHPKQSGGSGGGGGGGGGKAPAGVPAWSTYMPPQPMVIGGPARPLPNPGAGGAVPPPPPSMFGMTPMPVPNIAAPAAVSQSICVERAGS